MRGRRSEVGMGKNRGTGREKWVVKWQKTCLTGQAGHRVAASSTGAEWRR